MGDLTRQGRGSFRPVHVRDPISEATVRLFEAFDSLRRQRLGQDNHSKAFIPFTISGKPARPQDVRRSHHVQAIERQVGRRH